MVIEIKDLTKKYPLPGSDSWAYALKGIDLEVKRGEICGIIGMSGAGKSTLMKCLTALDSPTEGSISIAGEEISKMTGENLRGARKKMGMIFQHFNLFQSRSALENVCYPLEIVGVSHLERRKRGLELLQLVGLANKADCYPAEMSGGEQQRVAIARALANEPEVLFCDEATSALDPKSTQTILQLLVHLNQKMGLTIVLITHEMELVKQICTYVAVLDHGEIVEKGRVDELFSFPQHPITKQFLQNLPHPLPSHVHSTENAMCLRLFFKGESARKPLISRMIKTYDIEANILQGGIDFLRTAAVGTLVIEITGTKEEREKARLFLESEGVHTELL